MSQATRRKFVQRGVLAGSLATLSPLVVQASSKVDDELAALDALGWAKLVRQKKVSPLELLEYSIGRLEASNPKINAIAGTMYDHARKAIKAGLPDGPFTGVPFLLKDISFAMKDVASGYGSRLFQGQVAKRDSTTVGRFRKAGLVMFARTRVPELGLLPTTESTVGGVTRNPYDLERTAGGSSGGSAAAVAAGIAPMASASDGGGSIRIPASCCGLFGLKPTRARVPIGPEGFESWGGLGVLHGLTRSVRDSAALLDAIAGPAVGDSYAAPPKQGSYLAQVTRSPGKLRIALVKSMRPANPPAADCEKALMETGKLCESLGHSVEEQTDNFNRQFMFADLRQSHGKVVLVALKRRIDSYLAQLGRELKPGELEPVTRYYYDLAAGYTAIEIQHCRNAFFEAARAMGEYQRQFDLILTPTLGVPPVPHGEITLTGTGQQVIDGLLKFTPCCGLANWTGQPAMTLPLSTGKNGIPIGVQFMGRFGDEATLFRVAGQLERAKPWRQRRPGLQ